MTADPVEWSTVFYQTAAGRIPAREWLETQSVEVQERFLALLRVLRDRGGQLDLPHARHLTGKVWELRVQVRGSAYRLLYSAVTGRRILLLHGFRKTAQQTPTGGLNHAVDRLNDFLRREEG